MSRWRNRADEALVWAEYARTVRPLPGRPTLPAPPAPAPKSAPRAETVAPAPRVASHRVAPVAVGTQPAGIDTGTWQRFRGGRLVAERTLDLHGRTAQHAHGALLAFVQAAYADGVRCVEVVTGRGSGEAGGVIRRELPLWLNLPALRPLILAAAHPHAANVGATRLLLRRVRQG